MTNPRYEDVGPSVEVLDGPAWLLDLLAETAESFTAAPLGLTSGHVVGDLSGLWNLTAAAPRQVAGPSLQELDDAADAMAAVVATQLGRVAGFAARNLGGVTIASGLWDFHLAGQHDQASHGRGGDYHATYGDVIDEASAGANLEYTVAYTETSDMHIAYDNPKGSGSILADREVVAEIDPDGARGLADELRWAADYDHSNDVPDDLGIVDTTDVVGAEHLEVWVHESGEVGIRNVEREGQPGWDMDEDDAAGFADALDEMADSYEDYFRSNQPTSAALTAQAFGPPSGLWTFQTGSPGPGTPRQAAVSADDLGVIRDRWTVITDDVLGPKIAADYLAGAKGQHNRLAAALPPKVRRLASRPLADRAALLYAAGAANRLKGIGDELWQAARTALLEGMAKGESVAKLARRIRDATGVSMGRATTIARTESMGARSAGSYEEMLASGVVVSKTWQATGDLRTRPTHVIADGQTVPMAGKFTVGGWPADRPHDPMLPAEEAVNCRCTLTYGVDTDVATAASAAEAAPPDLWIFHLPGGHNQETHGGGSVGPGGGVDLLTAGHGEALAAGALADAEANSYDFDRERFEPLAGRHLYRGGGVGPHGDEALHSIAEKQGFGGPARKMSGKEMDRGVKAGDTAMYRGVQGNKNMTASQIHERTAIGEPYYGLGFSGNGIYASSSRSEAGRYGQVGRYTLHRHAKIVDYRDLQIEQGRFLDSVGHGSVQGRVFRDPGRYAAAKGYDAIRWRRGEEAGKAPGVEDEFIVLNRTATFAEWS